MKLEFSHLREWLGTRLINRVDDYRRKNGDLQRERKLGTIDLVFLFIGLSLHCRVKSLHELLRTIGEELDIDVTVQAFSKARKRFSPQAFAVYPQQACSTCRKSIRVNKSTMARLQAFSHR